MKLGLPTKKQMRQLGRTLTRWLPKTKSPDDGIENANGILMTKKRLTHPQAMRRLRKFLPKIRSSSPTHDEVVAMYQSFRGGGMIFFRCVFGNDHDLQGENKRLRAALGFYMDEENWSDNHEYVDGRIVGLAPSNIMNDEGKTARAALRGGVGNDI